MSVLEIGGSVVSLHPFENEAMLFGSEAPGSNKRAQQANLSVGWFWSRAGWFGSQTGPFWSQVQRAGAKSRVEPTSKNQSVSMQDPIAFAKF